jgi:hypothetical protein
MRDPLKETRSAVTVNFSIRMAISTMECGRMV